MSTSSVRLTLQRVRERVEVKSPVRENCTPGSVRGAPGNRRPYRDRRADQSRERAQDKFLLAPRSGA